MTALTRSFTVGRQLTEGLRAAQTNMSKVAKPRARALETV